jgi:ABC-type lipoprotein release transport system permease subunit
LERQLDAELRFHLEQRVSDLIRNGVRPAEVRRQAALELGGLEQIKVQWRDPMTLGVVGALTLTTALLATFLATRRATRIDPTRALKME